MLRKLAVASAVLFLVAVFVPAISAESDLDFTLVNATGYGISELYVAPSASSDWGDSVISDVLENNQSVAITFKPRAAAVENWDLMVTWVDGGDHVYWRNLKLAQISKITLKYNRDSGETTAIKE